MPPTPSAAQRSTWVRYGSTVVIVLRARRAWPIAASASRHPAVVLPGPTIRGSQPARATQRPSGGPSGASAQCLGQNRPGAAAPGPVDTGTSQIIWTPPLCQGCLQVTSKQYRLQFYIRPVMQTPSLRALMESADPLLISPVDSLGPIRDSGLVSHGLTCLPSLARATSNKQLNKNASTIENHAATCSLFLS
jgi:hypothetical protein